MTGPAHLISCIQSSNVVLEGIRYPSVFDPYVGDPLQCVPTIFTHGSVNKLVKVFVVAEDHMATHIKEKTFRSDISAGKATCVRSLEQ